MVQGARIDAETDAGRPKSQYQAQQRNDEFEHIQGMCTYLQCVRTPLAIVQPSSCRWSLLVRLSVSPNRRMLRKQLAKATSTPSSMAQAEGSVMRNIPLVFNSPNPVRRHSCTP